MTRLTSHELAAYQDDGAFFPISLLNAAELDAFKRALRPVALRLGGPGRSSQIGQTHLFFRWAYDLATHPAVLDCVEEVIGPDIIIHTTSVFYKTSLDPRFVSWHQDGHYWDMSEPRLTTAWVALTDSNEANGCLRVLPGSHRLGPLAHTETGKGPGNLLRSGLQVMSGPDETRAVSVTLKAGEMSIHHANMLHSSLPNRSAEERIGFAIRFASPAVRQQLPHHKVVLARGIDRHHNFDLLERPPAYEFEDAIRAHADLIGWARQVRDELRARRDSHNSNSPDFGLQGS